MLALFKSGHSLHLQTEVCNPVVILRDFLKFISRNFVCVQSIKTKTSALDLTNLQIKVLWFCNLAILYVNILKSQKLKMLLKIKDILKHEQETKNFQK